MLNLAVLSVVLAVASAQTYKVCVPSTERALCNNLDMASSPVVCEHVESRIDCAIKLSRGSAQFGAFTDEETILLGQQSADYRVLATIRNVNKTDAYAWEAVAIVRSSHTGQLEGLKGARLCHPGMDNPRVHQRWSPRALKAFETSVVRLDQCPTSIPPGLTVEEVEVQKISEFFAGGCRPGPWSYNATIDATLKSKFPNLCSSCGNTNNSCNYAYAINSTNQHIQALECMRTNNHSVAYVAWQHVREFFTVGSDVTSFAVLCPDGTTRPLTNELISSTTSPCAFVRQPWRTIIASASVAADVLSQMKTWWPQGQPPTNPSDTGAAWKTSLFNGIVGGANERVFFEDTLLTPANYTSSIRPIPAIDATTTCQPARRWCTLSAAEHTKCSWLRAAAHSLGIQPTITCLQRATIFACLKDIKEDRADFIASSSNYGYLARQHYSLSPIKLMQNVRNSNRSTSRVAAFVKESAVLNNSVIRFENLRGKKACFPEYGGIAYVAFVRTAHERSIIDPAQCDYLRAVGELFAGACAPGALDASHALKESDYNATNLCSVCQPTITSMGNYPNSVCTWDWSNRFYGNNGSLACLADSSSDVAFLQTENIDTYLAEQRVNGSLFRAMCRNNTLASAVGFAVDDDCLLSHTVDSEVVTRRNDPLNNALSVLLETLDLFFGYLAESDAQLINFEIFSPFDGTSDLLFKDSAIGFSEPSMLSDNALARNYVELFKHLEACTGAAHALSAAGLTLSVTLLMAVFAQFVV